MKRKIYDKLLGWKNTSKGDTALLIDGARRVGKSYIAEEFAKENYKSYILVDFNKVNDDVCTLFVNYLDDLDTLFMYLSSYYNTKLYKRESVIIFDEVQMFPKARAAIKYLVADGRYDYIETGSLMSIRKNVKDITIPSEERHIRMYPMDFEEFLWAMDNEMLMPVIRDCFEKKKPMGQMLHRKAMDYFRQYMIVGGMPQAVKKYIQTRDFEEVDITKRNILTLYREDIMKHSDGNELEIEAIFDEIPAQLSKHEKKFKLSDIKPTARMREYKQPFYWLDDAMIVNTCYNSSEPNIGLKMNMDRKTLKCYMADTGLLISHAFDENGIVSEEIYKKLLFDKLSVNSGMLMENIVAQMLTAAGHKLYFYSKSSREKAEDRMEIDFLIAKSKITNKHNISPIEVKSGDRYTLSSIKKFMNKYKEQTNIPYVLHTKDLKEENGITYLPLYMTMLL
ncbi:MAG: ATP-binding protein [Ruminococcaceae bacterium]|nr:ATP-binding protein [Oscillospiraceae bacterium]